MRATLIRVIVPTALVLLALGQAPRILSAAAGLEYRPLPLDIEGQRIVEHRKRIAAGGLDKPYDFLMAGTSRTMADFGPNAVSRGIAAQCGSSSPPAGYNLGNVANTYTQFERLLPKLPRPRVLMLEFAPHVLMTGKAVADVRTGGQHSRYAAYRDTVRTFEARLGERLRSLLGLEDPLRVGPGAFAALARYAAAGRLDVEHLYLAVRTGQGYGQMLQPDGQVLYRTYLTGRRQAELLGGGIAQSEYETYRQIHLVAPASEPEFAALQRILEWSRAENVSLLLVRAPVAPRLYDLENQAAQPVIARIAELARRHSVPLLDLNPSVLSSVDLSHVDWFDTPAAAASLVRQVTAGGAVCAAFSAH